jgi:tetratricopeptide (TPR) repeat protein
MLYARDPQALDLFRSAGVSEYSFNALVQVLVEQGAIGAVLCLGWTFTLLWRLYRTSRPLFAGILALLLFSCFSYPFEMLPYSIILVASTALCASAHTPKEEAEKTATNTRWGYALTLGIVAALLSLPLRSETLKRQEAARDAELVTGMHDPFFLKDCWELLPTERDDPRFLFNMAKMLEQKERWRDSNAILRMGTQVCGDPMFYVLMGNNYRKMEMNDLAEESYRKAFAILPNRMYPLYQLMLLYKETDRQEEALQIAKQIFEMRPKVKSPATDEMQEKALDLLAPKSSFPIEDITRVK